MTYAATKLGLARDSLVEAIGRALADIQVEAAAPEPQPTADA